MSRTLEVFQDHHANEVADMQTVGCRVNTQIRRRHFFLQLFISAGHHLVDHAAPCQFFYKIHCLYIHLLTANLVNNSNPANRNRLIFRNSA